MVDEVKPEVDGAKPETLPLFKRPVIMPVAIEDGALTSGLSDALITRLEKLSQVISLLITPYEEEYLNPMTMTRMTRTVKPRVEVRVRMPEKGSAQIIVQRVKPMEEAKVVDEFSGADFTALLSRIDTLGLSWEHYMEQVGHGR